MAPGRPPTAGRGRWWRAALPALALLTALLGLLRAAVGPGWASGPSGSATRRRGDGRGVAAVETVPVFYNLFTKEAADVERVKGIVAEQLALLRAEHRVFVHSIGVAMEMDDPRVTLLAHHVAGDEEETLHSLWEYCTINPQAKVVYLHSKGSFHPSIANDRLRRFLTAGALSQSCLQLPDSCDVCSSRMSPLPHPHTAGNMWLARCRYVRRLIDPRLFAAAMAAVPRYAPRLMGDSCFGRGRYAVEHWALSHPAGRPCDLAADPRYVWNYIDIPDANFSHHLAPAPRFPLAHFVQEPHCPGVGLTAAERLLEYQSLYNATPPADWWGRGLFNYTVAAAAP